MAGSFGFNRINWNAMALCILAASVFWLFSALNEEHVSSIQLPLNIDVDEASFIPVGKNPQMVAVRVEGKGWELLGKQLNWRKDQVIVTVTNPVTQPYILTHNLETPVREIIGGLRLIQFQADSLFLKFENKKIRSVSVTADLSDVQFRKGYAILDSVKLSPDVIKISGPASEMDKIADPVVISVTQRNFSGKFQQAVRPKVSDLINSEPTTVLVNFDAVRVKEISMMIPVVANRKNFRLQRAQKSDSIRIWLIMPEDMTNESLKNLYAEISKTGSGAFVSSFNGIPPRVRVIQSDSL